MKTFEIVNQLISLNQEDSDYSQKRMELMVKYLQRYLETYDAQVGYKNYTDQTFIDDVLYGLGVALNPEKHQYSDGYERWKNELLEFLK